MQSEYPNLSQWLTQTRIAEGYLTVIVVALLGVVGVFVVVSRWKPTWFPIVRAWFGVVFVILSLISLIVR